MGRTVAETVVDYLRAEGVRHVFGVIGSALLDIMDVLYRTREIQYIATQHEQGAAFAADGYARITRGPGVCMATVGPGATNLVSGIAQAYVESSPVIAIVGEVSTRIYGKGASNFHEIDQVSMFRPITKLSVRLERPERIGEIMQLAFRTALSGRKGPVYIGIPKDLTGKEVNLEVPSPEAYRPTCRVRPDEESLSRALDILLGAKRPAILAGGGVLWSDAIGELEEFATLTGIPVAATETHKGILPEDHPLYLGSVGTLGSPVAVRRLRVADAILCIGCTLSQNTTIRYGNLVIPPSAKLIHVDIDPAEIGKTYPVSVGLVGDARAVLKDLINLARTAITDRRAFIEASLAEVATAKQQLAEERRGEEASSAVPITRPRLWREIRSAVSRDAIIVGESGATHMWFVSRFPAYTPAWGPGEFSVMGSGLCIALGMKVARPERQVVCITGDGAFMMTGLEMATAVKNNIPIVVVVPHNSVYGNVRWQQKTYYGGRYIGTDLPVPDLAKLAEVLGAHGERVEKPGDIAPAIKRALACGKPAVVDVLIDASEDTLVPPDQMEYPVGNARGG